MKISIEFRPSACLITLKVLNVGKANIRKLSENKHSKKS